MEKEKILIIGCQNAMDTICIGCSRCLVSFNRNEGMFDRYKEKDAELLGLLSCGGCPGPAIITRMIQVKLWNAPLGERPTKIHVAPCIGDHCPYAEDIITKIKVKSGIEVVEGTHPYMPAKVYAD